MPEADAAVAMIGTWIHFHKAPWAIVARIFPALARDLLPRK
jgi:hypothetical protein